MNWARGELAWATERGLERHRGEFAQGADESSWDEEEGKGEFQLEFGTDLGNDRVNSRAGAVVKLAGWRVEDGG